VGSVGTATLRDCVSILPQTFNRGVRRSIIPKYKIFMPVYLIKWAAMSLRHATSLQVTSVTAAPVPIQLDLSTPDSQQVSAAIR
jgi:hypothetical protein